MDDYTNKEFPFPSKLNLRLLVEYWEENIQQSHVQEFTKGIQEYIDNAPELKKSIEDPAILEKHRPFIEYLMSAVIPQSSHETDLIAAIYPFTFKAFYSTKAFERTIDIGQIETKAKANLPGSVSMGKVIKGCLMILEKFYNTNTYSDRPVLFSWRDEKTGLDKVYKVEINHQFCEVIPKKTPPPIDKQVIKFLMEKTYDIDLWFQYIHPENFEFQGFIVLHLIDVTEQEMLSSIKYDLLGKNAVVRPESFSVIQQKLRSLFGIPEIRLGIAYFDPNNNLILNSATTECWRSLAESPMEGCNCEEDYAGSVYERSWMEKRYITIENLREYPFQSKVEETLLANGINNILLAPLIDEDETIGMLELATPIAGKLNSVSAHKVENVLPMFTAAVKRVKEEMSTEVRAIIQEECTAIHPTVQWRFFEAGVNLMNKRRKGEKAAMEEIVFKDVYPLFGMADVRNSSTERNSAIQKDLQQNLQLVKDLLTQINIERRLPLLDEVIFKTDNQLKSLSRGLASGDESNVLDFLHNEIDPLVRHFSGDQKLEGLVTRYKDTLDPNTGVVYKRRKSFEDSLQQINSVISNYLDEAEVSAQQMFPHYFEKYKTDGVEYSLYVGSGLVKNRKFDPFYLKNFHLWQLLTMSEIYRRVELLKPSLKTPLDITQLILVHDQPISIRFRPDEKQFDVDGAYDIRYEIIKKRIDKAFIKNTDERLTQPGKIAIVYNQTRVEDEFRRYFHYLKARNLVSGPIEDIELEELPGATGLRALRFQLTMEDNPKTEIPKDLLLRDIEEGLRVH
jgi:hypothetical protein